VEIHAEIPKKDYVMSLDPISSRQTPIIGEEFDVKSQPSTFAAYDLRLAYDSIVLAEKSLANLNDLAQKSQSLSSLIEELQANPSKAAELGESPSALVARQDELNSLLWGKIEETQDLVIETSAFLYRRNPSLLW
jgi:hypothetical protein